MVAAYYPLIPNSNQNPLQYILSQRIKKSNSPALTVSLALNHSLVSLGRLTTVLNKGLELSASCSPIDPKMVQENLKNLVSYLEKAEKIEQTLIIRKYIKNILYSKESIQINMLCHTEVIDRQSIKNPAPLLNVQACGCPHLAASPEVAEIFLPQKQKGVTPKSNSFIKHGSPSIGEIRTFVLN